MKFSILSVFPELYEAFLATSLIQRAQEKGIVSFDVASFFSYVAARERIDAPTFGPGPGMVIKPTVVEKAIEDKVALHGKPFVIFFSPQGEVLNQRLVKRIAKKVQELEHVMLVTGRYEGMDERVETYYADMVVSLGDFVLMGGDLPAMMLTEAVLRLIPGVVGKYESVERESFSGPFLDYPEYAELVIWKGFAVPEVVRSGHHGHIDAWRMEKALEKTVMERFDWLRSYLLTEKEKEQVSNVIPEHYVALCHGEVLIGPDSSKGTTSVTSIDIHDIARTACTYGIKQFFIVTPLIDQKNIVQTLLDFWQKGVGKTYNEHRYQALSQVKIFDTIDKLIESLEKMHGVRPIVIATSARLMPHRNIISFYDQKRVWSYKRPVLILFGTGKGLSVERVEASDYVLRPVEGISSFNHLSVRSAAAIVLDRWLGINVLSE